MLIKLILLGTLQVTSYQPIPAQTKPECLDRWHCATANGDGLTMYGFAASQDLLKSGEVKFGDIIYVENFGYRVCNDSMGPRARRSIDLLVFTHAAEKHVGVRHLRVWLISRPTKTEIAKEAK